MVEPENEPITGRQFYLHVPDRLADDDQLLVVLNLHGGGSSARWQDRYFPVHRLVDRSRLVVATPWLSKFQLTTGAVPHGEDDHLVNIIDLVVHRIGVGRVAALWLAGHSRGGFVCYRLLQQPFFADRVDGWLSLSGGRIGWTDTDGESRPPPPRRHLTMIPGDFSFIFAVGGDEIEDLPDSSSLAERYGAGPRYLEQEIIDDEVESVDQPSRARPRDVWRTGLQTGRARLFRYPTAPHGPLVADIVRLAKGHTEGIEPNLTAEIVRLMQQAPGGKLRRITG